MKQGMRMAALAALMTALSGCQYVTYFKTNTTTAPSHLQSSAETSCAAMGATRGDASFDWCVAQEEADRARGPSRSKSYSYFAN